MNSEHRWHSIGLFRILFFLQPIKQLQAYNNFNNHQEFMSQSTVNYNLLTPLQVSFLGSLSDRLEKNIENLDQLYQQSLFKAVWLTFRDEFLYYFSIVQVCVIIKISVPYFLAKLLDQLNDKSEEPKLYLVMVLSVLLFCQVLFEQHYFQNIYQFSIKLRHSIVGMIYKKITSAQSSKYKGQIFNIITMDLIEIDSGLTWFIALSGSIIIGIFGTIQLYRNFGVGCFAGIVALLGVNFLQQNIITFQKKSKEQKNIYQDQRTRLVSEILAHIRSLKMFTTENIYRNELIDLREKQDHHTRIILFFDTLSQLLSGNISVVIAMLIMQCFCHSDQNNIYSSLWVLQLIKVWCLTYFYRGRKFWVNMLVLNKRVSEILETTISMKVVVKKSNGFQQVTDEEEISLPDKESFKKVSIEAKEYSGYQQEGGFKLENLTFNWEQGQLIGIIGQVGSGKTTLLQALLGESNKLSGSIQVQGSISYVEQNPFIFPGTIQSNILFGNPMDENKYRQAINFSQLTQDLQYKGDLYQVGDRGAKLSGGQKARLSLARAIYSDSMILFLDDILAAVDTRVAQKIFQEGIIPLIGQGKTIVMVTHQTQLVKFFNQIVVMENGRIVKQGKPHELTEYIQQILNVKEDNIHESNQINDQEQQEDILDNPETLEQLDNQTSYGNLDLYRWYIQEIGGIKILGFIILSYMIAAILNIYIMKAFGYGVSMTIIAILGLVYALTTITKLNLVYQNTLNGIQNMHRKLCTSVTRAEIRILDQSNTGQLISRFTSDLNNVEGMVLLDSHWVLEGCTDNLLVVLISCTQNIYTVFIAIAFLIWMLTIKTKFSNAMKYATKCDDISRGNLLNFIEASINGSTLIRIYKKVDYFYKDMLDLVYMNMQSYYMFLRLNATLAFTFEMSLHLFIIFMLVSITLFQKENASEAGFNLFILLSLGYMFSLNLRGQIYLDIDMQNVQRIRTTTDIPIEEQLQCDKDDELIEKWPSSGQIEFRNVSLIYQKSFKVKKTYALKNISFIIQPGQSIGIVGRTGAGKSSIISTLFRLHEIDSGTIYYDGIDIDSIGLHTLRERIQVIPQQAPLLSVSVRKNIDPKNEFKDENIMDAIRKVGLHQKITQLDQILEEYSLSAGERQLFMFACVILRQKCKVLVLDEATSNVDFITDKFVTQLLKDYFQNTTKIIIAHRLQTILHCDQVLVLDQGEVIQYDNPRKLIDDRHSKGFRSMVLALEQQQRSEILDLLQQ